MSKVKVKFVATNIFGVLDHKVTLPSGGTTYNPMRVFPNNNGSEVIFTLYQLKGMSEDRFAEDAMLVEKDINKLKVILEK